MDRKDESNAQDSLTETNASIDLTEQEEGDVREERKAVWTHTTANDMHIVGNIPTASAHLYETAPEKQVQNSMVV